ncbi:HIT family protein [Arcanobacterium hippocoleae]|uniref:HIT family protein n=1 Tax=Arcanobacterium hippocoleae TaxID=149017 RepID=UPI00333F81D0
MSIFTKIIDGEIPGRFVWQDEVCVAFATIEPVEAGHVLLVPRIEVDKFYDLDPEIFAHLAKVAQIIGRAQAHAFGTSRAIMSIFGFDVPHVHLHLHPGSPDTVKKSALQKWLTVRLSMRQWKNYVIRYVHLATAKMCQLKWES